MKNASNPKSKKKVSMTKKSAGVPSEGNAAGEAIGNQTGVIKFNGLKFKKAGYELASNDRLTNRVEYLEPIIERRDDMEIIEQNFYPLGAYKFEIISNMEVYIHVSLFEIVKYKPSWQTSKDSLQNCRLETPCDIYSTDTFSLNGIIFCLYDMTRKVDSCWVHDRGCRGCGRGRGRESRNDYNH